MPKNWNRRFKHNRDKIKTGDIYELAEVVRNLAIREHEKGLSTGEKQMFTRAKKILASELMYALDKDEDEAEELPRRAARGLGRRQGASRAKWARVVAVALVVAAGQWRAPWVRRAQGAGGGGGPPDARVVARRAARRRGDRADRRRAAAEGVAAPAGTVGVPGGAERSHSVLAALRASRGRPGGRPRRGAPARDAGDRRARRSRRCTSTAATRRSPPRRCTDTVKRRGRRRRARARWTARELWAVQTPQVFRRGGAGGRAGAGRGRPRRGRPTTRRSSRRRAASCGSCRRRRRTSRSRRRTTCRVAELLLRSAPC